MNAAARAIFGLRQDAVDGWLLLEAIRQKALFDLVEQSRTLARGESSRREIELGPPVGRTLEASAVAVAFAPEGRGTLLVLHDVTELRRLERVSTMPPSDLSATAAKSKHGHLKR